jgi:hypothetical protein
MAQLTLYLYIHGVTLFGVNTDPMVLIVDTSVPQKYPLLIHHG